MKSLKKVIPLIMVAAVLLLQGCASSGPAFQPVEAASSDGDKGVVYIYRPKKLVGAAVYYQVRVGEESVGKLANGSYIPYVTTPGEVEFWAKTESRSAVTLDVKAGKTYYIKGGLGVGFIAGRPQLSVVDNVTGATEIKECKLSQ